MRSLRWLLLVALVLIAAAVVGTYRSQRRAQRAQRRPVPAPVGVDTRNVALDWEWGQSANGLPQVHISAKDMKQSVDQSKVELKQIELRIYMKDGKHYDRVRSAGAQFDTGNNKLFSPGEAEITLEVPVDGEPPHQLTSITTSGINFDSKTGQAVSDQRVSFTFENGDGTCTGATYDPATHILNLNKDVVLNLKGKDPQSQPMKVEAGALVWGEATSRLILSPWSRLTRGATVINAGASTVQMENQLIRWIDAPQGHGTDKRPNRDLEYAADSIHVDYNDDGEMERMNGVGHAKLISHAPESETVISGDRVDMVFSSGNGESVLTRAQASGNGYIESKPTPGPKGDTPDVKLL
jgi:LPS export ABC transporter protein LptC